MLKIKKITFEKAGNTVEILKIWLNSTSKALVLRRISRRICEDKKTFVVTPNPEFLIFGRQNEWFREILNSATIAIPDGIGLVWAGKILGKPIKERISGIDLMIKLCQKAAKQGWKVFLLGGKPGVAKRAFEVLQKRYPGLKGWSESGPELKLEVRSGKWEAGREVRNEKWVEKINQKKPDCLFIAFGMGKQEKFIYDSWDKLKVKLAMGVGGAFDYLSGQAPRAPKWVRKAGFEWFYRLVRQPWRWRRQVALGTFIWLVLKEKFFADSAFLPFLKRN